MGSKIEKNKLVIHRCKCWHGGGRIQNTYQKKTRSHLWRTPDWLASTGLAWPLSVPWCHEAYLIPEHHLMIAVNGYFSTLKKTCIELMMIVNGGSGGEPRNYEWRNRSRYFFYRGGVLESMMLICCCYHYQKPFVLSVVCYSLLLRDQSFVRDHLYIL